MIRTSFDTVVLGAGVIGAACAWRLAQLGQRVAVVDPNPVGSGTTGAGMGHVCVMDDSEAQFALSNYSRTLWIAHRDEFPARVEYRETGTLWVAADDEEFAAVRTKHDWYTARGVATEILDERQLAAAEPNLRPGLRGGLLVPQDSVIYPPAAARWMLDRVREGGGQMCIGRAAASIGDQSVTLDDGTTLHAGAIVNAAACDAPRLTPDLAIRPRKGHLVITDRYPGFCHAELVELGYLKNAHTHSAESVAFNLQPRSTGQMLVGSSRQYGVESREIEPHVLRKMIARAVEYMPGLAGLRVVRSWTGFRPTTPDSLPLIGAHASHRGLFVAAGHEGLGITTALGTGWLIADLMLGRTPEIDAAPYSPMRRMEEPAHA